VRGGGGAGGREVSVVYQLVNLSDGIILTGWWIAVRVEKAWAHMKEHLGSRCDSHRSSPYRNTLDIQCLSSQTARSAGDALREIDAMQVRTSSSDISAN